ncbi:MAG: arginine--tRNA ligase [Actinomycetia bacterium]|nr:arginine--tRNA ligase [Actinomycetes bacterium]MCP4084680.1 arginine--tRNA ligase [Actinomycetes bacterium]
MADLGFDVPADRVQLERPANPDHGDWSSNVVLANTEKGGRNPRELAQELADRLLADPPQGVTTVEIAGPGFVNFRLDDSWLLGVLRTVVDQGVDTYARSNSGEPRKVNIEFVSANPTGPLHAGHARGACYADSVARLLERTGHDVSRENYLNDRGMQMHHFAASLVARKAGQEVPEDGYRGDYITDWAAEMPADADPLEWGYARALADHESTLARLNIHFDTWFSERSLVESGAIDQTLSDLGDRGVVFDEDGAAWLRSTDYGDDKDRVLVKSDGELTYITPDIAYHRDKFNRGFDLLIDVWGADHHGYVPRMKAALQCLGHAPDEFEVRITQLVRLMRDGEEVRMSKRTGDLVSIDEIIDATSPDAARFTYLLQSVDSSQVFDFDAVAAQSMDNPVYYVQMAHARACSIARNAAEKGFERQSLESVDLTELGTERELDVLRALFELPGIVELASRQRAPHRVTNWSREMAAAFHGFFHDCYVVGEGISPELTQARLWLTEAASIGLVISLDLLGVSAPERL